MHDTDEGVSARLPSSEFYPHTRQIEGMEVNGPRELSTYTSLVSSRLHVMHQNKESLMSAKMNVIPSSVILIAASWQIRNSRALSTPWVSTDGLSESSSTLQKS